MLSSTDSKMSRPSQRQGAAALELAIAMPLIVTLLLGCVDFGRFGHTYIAVTNAARAGADFASMNPVPSSGASTWTAGVKEAVADELGSSFDASKIAVPAPVTTVDANGFKRVRVQVNYPFQTLVPWPIIRNNAFTLTRAVEMRVIRY